MAKMNGIQNMSKEELENLMAEIKERQEELRREEVKEIVKKIFLGSKVKYLKKNEEVIGEINAITSDYVSVALEVEENGCKNRRLPYEKIIEVVAE